VELLESAYILRATERRRERGQRERKMRERQTQDNGVPCETKARCAFAARAAVRRRERLRGTRTKRLWQAVRAMMNLVLEVFLGPGGSWRLFFV